MLVDCRYNQKDKIPKLSKWVRSGIRAYPNFENSLSDMKLFFKDAEAHCKKWRILLSIAHSV